MAEGDLAQHALTARVEALGPLGRGTVSGADLTAAGINKTASALFDQGKRDQAIELWRSLADTGDAAATANLVIEYSADGRYDEALAMWRSPQVQGMNIPPHDPGLRLRTTNRRLAAEGWWRTATEHLKDDRSCEYLGIALRERGETDEAARWFRQGAERGDAACARELAGILYQKSAAATDADEQLKLAAEMLTWLRQAAAKGDDFARKMLRDFNLG